MKEVQSRMYACGLELRQHRRDVGKPAWVVRTKIPVPVQPPRFNFIHDAGVVEQNKMNARLLGDSDVTVNRLRGKVGDSEHRGIDKRGTAALHAMRQGTIFFQPFHGI